MRRVYLSWEKAGEAIEEKKNIKLRFRKFKIPKSVF